MRPIPLFQTKIGSDHVPERCDPRLSYSDPCGQWLLLIAPQFRLPEGYCPVSLKTSAEECTNLLTM